MILYKYTGLEYIRSCIEKGIYASRLDSINDPFEGKGIRYKDQYRVVCLTSSPFQMLMWAYYGNHRGCCIEFDVDDNIGVRPVQYIKDFLDHEIMSTTEVIESLYTKGNEWNHEKEYRLVYYAPQAEKHLWTIEGANVFLNARVRRITLGFASEMDSNYAGTLQYLSAYRGANKDTTIEVTKCKLMGNKYQLEADKQFDIENELKSIETGAGEKTITGTFKVYDGSYTIEDDKGNASAS